MIPIGGHPTKAVANASSGSKGAFVCGLAGLPVLDQALRLQLLASGDSQKTVRLQSAVAKFRELFPC